MGAAASSVAQGLLTHTLCGVRSTCGNVALLRPARAARMLTAYLSFVAHGSLFILMGVPQVPREQPVHAPAR